MVKPEPESRRQLVAGAADMIRRRGIGATSIREVAKHAQAPLGSTYHYFPGGKQQLATEAVRFAGDTVARTLDEKLRDGPLDGLRAFLALWREILTDTDFQAGCPVLAVAIEQPAGGESSSVHAAAAEAFDGWQSRLADSLRQNGADAAEQLATLVVAAVEGAVVLCRAHRSTQPLDRVAAQLDKLISANLPT
ncbi:TetR/AcrR family transcriptional regulator [Saccharopolyspora taberi]|uniref:TetR/AcrR family transcriptional regulator n=1 Tax=Saccharopolyspora taberi TaxID=60895 RepID=A0ABN3VHA7_9PSEU